MPWKRASSRTDKRLPQRRLPFNHFFSGNARAAAGYFARSARHFFTSSFLYLAVIRAMPCGGIVLSLVFMPL